MKEGKSSSSSSHVHHLPWYVRYVCCRVSDFESFIFISYIKISLLYYYVHKGDGNVNDWNKKVFFSSLFEWSERTYIFSLIIISIIIRILWFTARFTSYQFLLSFQASPHLFNVEKNFHLTRLYVDAVYEKEGWNIEAMWLVFALKSRWGELRKEGKDELLRFWLKEFYVYIHTIYPELCLLLPRVLESKEKKVFIITKIFMEWDRRKVFSVAKHNLPINPFLPANPFSHRLLNSFTRKKFNGWELLCTKKSYQITLKWSIHAL